MTMPDVADTSEYITDHNLWLEVGGDPVQYVYQLRLQGRLTPIWMVPRLLPRKPPTPPFGTGSLI
jgi:hypothetical protein